MTDGATNWENKARDHSSGSRELTHPIPSELLACWHTPGEWRNSGDKNAPVLCFLFNMDLCVLLWASESYDAARDAFLQEQMCTIHRYAHGKCDRYVTYTDTVHRCAHTAQTTTFKARRKDGARLWFDQQALDRHAPLLSVQCTNFQPSYLARWRIGTTALLRRAFPSIMLLTSMPSRSLCCSSAFLTLRTSSGVDDGVKPCFPSRASSAAAREDSLLFCRYMFGDILKKKRACFKKNA